ncbi:hypothetical protein [Spirosoma sp. KNUC1025]|uniref:hypothetical protein n=1 Tax=Spirosoma sp. KNUC1025 TaxID=2894082 RepID=UPI00386D178F|nr:hypothetical protein LN737_00565 [Spirosoma sp. KNUC1025]
MMNSLLPLPIDDLYFNAGDALYLRINTIYYKRIAGTGWQVILEDKVPEGVKWDMLHEKQREAMSQGYFLHRL